ncbi:MAG: hypothetical protein WKG07_16220 [Hymenobacter sp.]
MGSGYSTTKRFTAWPLADMRRSEYTPGARPDTSNWAAGAGGRHGSPCGPTPPGPTD